MTPNSNATSLLPAAQFLLRVDQQLVGNLVSQDARGATVSAASLPTNTVLLAVLDDASGVLESACLKGERYSPGDLAAMDGVSLKMMYRLLTAITMGLLFEIKADRDPSPGLARQFDWAMKMLKELADGEKVFSFAEAEDAGHMRDDAMSATDVANLGLVSFTALRYFGIRNNMRRPAGFIPSCYSCGCD